MNTDDPNPTLLSDNNQLQPTNSSNNYSGQLLADLVDALQSVDTQAPEALLNVTSIDDDNRGRIELNQDGEVIKK